MDQNNDRTTHLACCPFARALTLLALGLLTAGALTLLGSFAVAASSVGADDSTPALTEAYGQSFLTSERLANEYARAERKTETTEPTVSPLTQWTFTSGRNVSQRH